MPEFKCQNCGRHSFGWKLFMVCKFCGGRLEAVNESAKGREIDKEKK